MNLGDYHTSKHHSTKHHKEMRSIYVLNFLKSLLRTPTCKGVLKSVKIQPQALMYWDLQLPTCSVRLGIEHF